jgi:hypothetical protein
VPAVPFRLASRPQDHRPTVGRSVNLHIEDEVIHEVAGAIYIQNADRPKRAAVAMRIIAADRSD